MHGAIGNEPIYKAYYIKPFNVVIAFFTVAMHK